jgi:rhomboid family GlyGly-CTERM serine protease
MGDVFAAVSDWLQYDREAIAQGELWRLVTCHLVHFGLEHLVWDAAVFALLAVLCWRLGRVRCLVSLGAATLAIPAVLFVLQPGLPTYRGLSGLDSALFVTAALGLGQKLRADGRSTWGAAAIGSVAVLLGKVGYELATGQALFVDAASLGFVPVPLAHAVGGLAGMLGGLSSLLPFPAAARSPLRRFRTAHRSRSCTRSRTRAAAPARA